MSRPLTLKGYRRDILWTDAMKDEHTSSSHVDDTDSHPAQWEFKATGLRYHVVKDLTPDPFFSKDYTIVCKQHIAFAIPKKLVDNHKRFMTSSNQRRTNCEYIALLEGLWPDQTYALSYHSYFCAADIVPVGGAMPTKVAWTMCKGEHRPLCRRALKTTLFPGYPETPGSSPILGRDGQVWALEYLRESTLDTIWTRILKLANNSLPPSGENTPTEETDMSSELA